MPISTPSVSPWRREFLKALVRVPSDNPPGDCAPHAEVAAKLLEELGFTVERHVVAEPFVKTYGMRSVVNLVVRTTFGSGKGPVIALNAHGDVVPPGEGWTFNPYGAEEKGGAIYGRGAAVSKSDFATYTFALLALKEQPEGLDGTVELHFTYDEEAGGFLGPKWLLEHELTKPDYASPPASPIRSSSPTTARCISRSWCAASRPMPRCRRPAPTRWRRRRRSSPPSMQERARLYGITSATPGIGSPKITVGLISGGINTNVVPDRIVMRVDRRLTPEEDGLAVEAALTTLIEQAVADRAGIEVECRRIILAEPLRTLPGTERLVEAIQKHADRGAGRDAAGDRRAALHRRPPLHRAGHSDRAAMAPARAPFSRPTPTPPTSMCASTISRRRPSSSNGRCGICSRQADRGRQETKP